MRNSARYDRNGPAKRCAICGGRFGLIRYYSCQTALCSRKCDDRLQFRREDDRRWLSRLEIAA